MRINKRTNLQLRKQINILKRKLNDNQKVKKEEGK